MNTPTRRTLSRAATTSLLLLLPAAMAWADGRIKFTIIDAKTRLPLSGASIVLEPSADELDPRQYNPNAEGSVTTGDLAPGQRRYRVKAVGYVEVKGVLNVIDNQVTPIEIQLLPQGDIIKAITDKVLRLDIDDPGLYTFRDRKFLDFYPNAIGNRQNINKSLRSVPGFVQDSNNRMHTRGDQNGASFVIDGFQVPGLLAGSASQLLPLDVIDSLKVRTSGYAPQFAGAGAVVETSLRPAMAGLPTADKNPLLEYRLTSEDYFGKGINVTFGRRVNGRFGRGGGNFSPVKPGDERTGFLVNYSYRGTRNMVESPQPQRQMAGNSGTSTNLFVKVEHQLGKHAELNGLVLNDDSRTRISNRVGLSSAFLDRGQGFGFGGNKNFDDLPPLIAPNTAILAANQNRLGNRVFQWDTNRISVLQYKRSFQPDFTGTLSIGRVSTRQNTKNRTPGGDLNNLPDDLSIEYKPTNLLGFDYNQVQLDFALDPLLSKHRYRFGFLTQALKGDESYTLFPMSQTALNALLNINGFVGNGFAPVAGTASTARIHRTGSYNALYAQDTFGITDNLRLNAGARLESISQKQQMRFVSGNNNATLPEGTRSKTAITPRVNLVYLLPQKPTTARLGKMALPLGIWTDLPTTLRVSYNQYLNAPGVSQGAIGTNQTTGNTPMPVAVQRTDQLDVSVERQLRGQNVRLSVFNKNMKDPYAWQQMIQGPQSGTYMMVNQAKAESKGYELLYEFKPRSLFPRAGQLDEIKQGVSGFMAYTNSRTKWRGVQANAPLIYADQDQRQTVNMGVSYRAVNGSSVGLSYYYGSGLPTSVIDPGSTSRSRIQELNLFLRTRPGLIRNTYGVEFGIENLTDARNIYTFDQGPISGSVNSFAGTRFQQGRRAVLTLFGKF